MKLDQVAFSACSYIADRGDVRARMVRNAFESWGGLLQLPFAEKIFLDDRSPHFNGLKLLSETSAFPRFDRVQYQTRPHPPHSNFGIVGCLHLASSPFILHLDDDIFVKDSPGACQHFIEGLLDVLERDTQILGCNVLEYNQLRHGGEWAPGEAHPDSGAWSFPRKYFGTGACLIRRELLERVPFEQLMDWGETQPANWEELVTKTPREFLVGSGKTPFESPATSFFYSSTANNSWMDRFRYESQRGLRAFKSAVKGILPKSVLSLYRWMRKTGQKGSAG